MATYTTGWGDVIAEFGGEAPSGPGTGGNGNSHSPVSGGSVYTGINGNGNGNNGYGGANYNNNPVSWMDADIEAAVRGGEPQGMEETGRYSDFTKGIGYEAPDYPSLRGAIAKESNWQMTPQGAIYTRSGPAVRGDALTVTNSSKAFGELAGALLANKQSRIGGNWETQKALDALTSAANAAPISWRGYIKETLRDNFQNRLSEENVNRATEAILKGGWKALETLELRDEVPTILNGKSGVTYQEKRGNYDYIIFKDSITGKTKSIGQIVPINNAESPTATDYTIIWGENINRGQEQGIWENMNTLPDGTLVFGGKYATGLWGDNIFTPGKWDRGKFTEGAWTEDGKFVPGTWINNNFIEKSSLEEAAKPSILDRIESFLGVPPQVFRASALLELSDSSYMIKPINVKYTDSTSWQKLTTEYKNQGYHIIKNDGTYYAVPKIYSDRHLLAGALLEMRKAGHNLFNTIKGIKNSIKEYDNRIARLKKSKMSDPRNIIFHESQRDRAKAMLRLAEDDPEGWILYKTDPAFFAMYNVLKAENKGIPIERNYWKLAEFTPLWDPGGFKYVEMLRYANMDDILALYNRENPFAKQLNEFDMEVIYDPTNYRYLVKPIKGLKMRWSLPTKQEIKFKKALERL